MGADLTLEFTREVIILNGGAVIGTVSVEVEQQDGLFYFTATGFEPETPQSLTWEAVEAPCEAWLARNKGRVKRRARE